MMNRQGYSIACAKLDAALSTNVQAWASNYWICSNATSQLCFIGKLQLYTCPLLLKLLAKWPDPREFKRQHPATLEAIFEQFGYKKPEQRDPLIKSIKDAPLYTKDVVILVQFAQGKSDCAAAKYLRRSYR